MPATREAVEKAFGPKAGKLFVKNPAVEEYAVAFRFPDTKVIVSAEIKQALRKSISNPGPVLIIARDLEARRAAADARCDVTTEREWGWTDAAYQGIRQR